MKLFRLPIRRMFFSRFFFRAKRFTPKQAKAKRIVEIINIWKFLEIFGLCLEGVPHLM